MKNIDIREDYSNEITEEREITISSRNSLIEEYKKWPTDLWMKVLQRAIEDAAYCKSLRDADIELSEEEKEWEMSALSFLFDENHKIAFDDYLVDITCTKCNHVWPIEMSIVSAEMSICPVCNNNMSPKYVVYDITEEQSIREISLEELISLWGVNNIKTFREGCLNRIEELSKRKKPRAKPIVKKEKPMAKEQLKLNLNEVDEYIKETEKAESPGNEDKHYKGNIQPIDFAEMQGLGVHEHAVLKYICRYKDKGGVLDLKKAIWYLIRLIKIEENKE